jgi:hypothetical protein
MGELHPLICLVLIFFALSVLGAWVLRMLRAGETSSIYHPLIGWAAFVFLAVVLGTTNRFGVMGATVIVFFFAFFFSLLLLSKKKKLNSVLPMLFFGGLLLGLPLFMFTAEIKPHAWDDFSHWLPNAYYLFSRGSFPFPSDGMFTSAWPAYPYAFSLLIAGLSWAHGSFVEAAGPLLNLALLSLFSSFVTRLITPRESKFLTLGGAFAAILLSLIFIHPAFNQYLLFSSYSEYSTAIILGFLSYLCWQIFSKDEHRQEAILFSLIAVVFVQLRQANIYLLVLLLLSFALVYFRNALARAKTLAPTLAPCLTVWFMWFYHSAGFADKTGFAPSGDFRGDLFLPLLQAMAEVALGKSGYFLILIGLSAWAVRRAIKPKDEYDGLLKASALLFAGYFCFLVLAYLGSTFSKYEITHAASFFRYMSHLHLAVYLAFLLALAPRMASLCEDYPAVAKLAAGFAFLALPIAGAATGQYGWMPKPSPSVTAASDFAKAIAPAIAVDQKTGALLPSSDGLEAYVIRYNWMLSTPPVKTLFLGDQLTRFDYAILGEGALQSFASAHDVVIVGPNDTLAWNVFGQSAKNRWAAFHKQGSQWATIEPQSK